MTRVSVRRSVCLAWWTFWGLACVAPLAAQAEGSAEERAVARGRAVVEAFASGEVDKVWAALEEHLQPQTLEQRGEASWRALLTDLSEDLAGAKLTQVSIDDGRLQLRARAGDRGVIFGFEIEGSVPHRLGGFELRPDQGEAGDGPRFEPAMDRAEVERKIGDFVRGQVEELGFSGTVLVAKEGEIWFESAHGLSHRGYDIPNHAGTRFDLGSINKLFTKLAIAQLVASGQLSLDATVAELLPDYPNRQTAARITVRHLASHRSGLGDIFGEAYRRLPKDHLRSPEDFFPLFAHEPLLFEPGEGRQYSNAGYQVLGAIVAAVSGLPYHDYIAEKIWVPAGMEATAFIARDEPTPDVAVGYTRRHEDGRLRNNLFRLPVIGSPAGSSFSTTGDMLRFDRALRGGRLVERDWAAWVLTREPGTEQPPLEHLAMGFGGGAPGVNAMYEIAGPWTVVVLANQDPPMASKLGRPLARALGDVEG